MADKPLSLQDRFLNGIRRSKTRATIYLIKGVKLEGVITWFDAFSLLLRREGSSQLIYKHAVTTIMPVETPPDLLADGPIAQRKAGTLQDVFLSAAERERQEMTLYLVNGIMLQGHVVGFDQFSLLLERNGEYQLIYKHALSTLQPAQPLALGPDDDNAGADPAE